MPQFTEYELSWRKKLRIPNCAKTWPYDQNGKSRYHPITKERIKTDADSPTSFTRIAYADAWGISLDDLKHYNVVKGYNLCHTPHCCNPLHWRIYPKDSSELVPRTPYWVQKAAKGEWKCFTVDY